MRDSFVASESRRQDSRKEEKENLPFPRVCTASNPYCPWPIQALCQGQRGIEGAELSQRVPTPPVFCRKRLQLVENKERERRKERQEIPRGGKLMKRKGARAVDVNRAMLWCGNRAPLREK